MQAYYVGCRSKKGKKDAKAVTPVTLNQKVLQYPGVGQLVSSIKIGSKR